MSHLRQNHRCWLLFQKKSLVSRHNYIETVNEKHPQYAHLYIILTPGSCLVTSCDIFMKSSKEIQNIILDDILLV